MKHLKPKVVICEINEDEGPNRHQEYDPKIHLHQLVSERRKKYTVWDSVRSTIESKYLPIQLSNFRTTQYEIVQNVYFKRMKEFGLEFIDISSDKAKSGKVWTNWYKHPYLFIFVVNCGSSGRYKGYVKKVLTNLISYCIRKGYEYLIMYAHRGRVRGAGGGIKLFNRMTQSIYEKLKNDFAKERLFQLTVTQKIHKEYEALMTKITEKILYEFVKRIEKFDDKITDTKKYAVNRVRNKEEEEKEGNGFHYFKFFILTEGLTFVFEQFGLYIEAISKYKELKQLMEIRAIKFEDFHDFDFCISRIISPDEKKYRNMIFDADITRFDFQTYIFARILNLFFLLENLEEVSKTTIDFINEMRGLLMKNLSSEDANISKKQKLVFVHSWCYCVGRVVIEKSQTIVTKFQEIEKIRSLFRALSDLYLVSRQELEKLGKIFELSLDFSDEKKGEEDDDEEDRKEKGELIIFTSNYHFSDRLCQALCNQRDYRKLFIELLHITRNSYKTGGRNRFFQSINKELSDVRIDQKKYEEATLLLGHPRISDFYKKEGWFSLATDIEVRSALCFLEGKKLDKFLENSIDVLTNIHDVGDKAKLYFISKFNKLKSSFVKMIDLNPFVALSYGFQTHLFDVFDKSISFGCEVNYESSSEVLDIIESQVEIEAGRKISLVLTFENFFPNEIPFDEIVLIFKSLGKEEIIVQSTQLIFKKEFVTKGLKKIEKNYVIAKFRLHCLNIGVYNLKYLNFRVGKLKLSFDVEKFLTPKKRSFQARVEFEPGVKVFYSFLLLNIIRSSGHTDLAVSRNNYLLVNGKQYFNLTIDTRGRDVISKGLLNIELVEGGENVEFLDFVGDFTSSSSKKKMRIDIGSSKGYKDGAVELKIPVVFKTKERNPDNMIHVRSKVETVSLFTKLEYVKNTKESFVRKKHFKLIFYEPFFVEYYFAASEKRADTIDLELELTSQMPVAVSYNKMNFVSRWFELESQTENDEDRSISNEKPRSFHLKLKYLKNLKIKNEDGESEVIDCKDIVEHFLNEKKNVGLGEILVDFDVLNIHHTVQIKLPMKSKPVTKFEVFYKLPKKERYVVGQFLPFIVEIKRKHDLDKEAKILYKIDTKQNDWMISGLTEELLLFKPKEDVKERILFIAPMGYGEKIPMLDVRLYHTTVSSKETIIHKVPAFISIFPDSAIRSTGYLVLAKQETLKKKHRVKPKVQFQNQSNGKRESGAKIEFYVVSRIDQVIPFGIRRKSGMQTSSIGFKEVKL